jgi:phage FluMu protein Com
MIRFQCSQCGKTINAADEHAGRKAKCPACQTVLVVPGATTAAPVQPRKEAPARTRPTPAAEEDVAVSPRKPAPRPAKPAPSAVRPKKPPRDEVDEVEEVEEVEEEEAAEEEEEFEEERPRRRRKKRRRWRGEWAECPNCGAPGDATRLWYTWWGGFVGPLVICHVRCNQCGTAYNGKTGDYNTTRILIYYGIGLAIVLVVVAVGAVAEMLK